MMGKGDKWKQAESRGSDRLRDWESEVRVWCIDWDDVLCKGNVERRMDVGEEAKDKSEC